MYLRRVSGTNNNTAQEETKANKESLTDVDLNIYDTLRYDRSLRSNGHEYVSMAKRR